MKFNRFKLSHLDNKRNACLAALISLGLLFSGGAHAALEKWQSNADIVPFAIIEGNTSECHSNCVSIGPNASADGMYTTSVGANSQATMHSATALGHNAKALGYNTTALGRNAEASYTNATAVGFNAKATGESSIAIGTQAKASGLSTTAVGQNSEASGLWSEAYGKNAQATESNTTALGFNTKAQHKNSTAIGSYSSTDRENSISFGNATTTRQLTHVAAGTQATDAVNKSQLDAVETKADSALNVANDASQKADNAFTRAEQAESNANQYTDMKIKDNNVVINNNIETAKNDAIEAGQVAANTAEKNANLYTDSKIQDNNVVMNQHIDNSRKEAISVSNQYTDQRFGELQGEMYSGLNRLDSKIDRVQKQANAGVAGAMAMSSIPYKSDTDFSAGLGLGQYRNGSAIAGGMQYNVNERVSVRGNVSWNNNDSAGAGVGLSVGW